MFLGRKCLGSEMSGDPTKPPHAKASWPYEQLGTARWAALCLSIPLKVKIVLTWVKNAMSFI